MESITDKIRLFKFDEKNKPNTFKFLNTINAIDLSVLSANIQILLTYGLEVKKPSQIKVCALDNEELVRRLEFAKKNSFLDKIVKNLFLLLDTETFKEEKKEVVIQNPIYELLDSEQTKNLNETTFQSYQELTDVIDKIINNLKDCGLKKDGVYNYLVKFVTNEYPNKKEIVYYSLTYKKDYTEDILNKINAEIDNCLK